MSWFTGDDGKRYHLFGEGGGEDLARIVEAPLIGQVPLVPELREGSDTGAPIVATDPSGEAARAFAQIAATVDDELAPTRIYNPELRVV
jgi:ATP-binding protein involved in chromosome partitioning